MKKYTVCICDGESPIRNELRKYILQYSFTYDTDIEIMELDSAEKLLDPEVSYDILFLDIRFNGRDIGIDVVERLRTLGNTSVFILITALKSMSIDGYRAEPFRFLLKPFTQEQITAVLHACISKLNRTVTYVKVTSDSLTELIRADKIMYIYSKMRKRYIVCTDGVTISTWQRLNEFMDHLPTDKFAYSHKCYIVNLDLVDTVRNEKVFLTDSTAIPLGMHYKDSFMKALLSNVNT